MYNEGNSNLINMATIYGTNELHYRVALMLTLLSPVCGDIRVIGISKIADRIAPKRTIIFGLVIWSGVVLCVFHQFCERVFRAGDDRWSSDGRDPGVEPVLLRVN